MLANLERNKHYFATTGTGIPTIITGIYNGIFRKQKSGIK